jgi:hypothetical protein
MGCDFYILKLLHIYYDDKEYLEVFLHRQRGDYIFNEDSDEDVSDEDYDVRINECVKHALTPRMKPIIIHINNVFTKSHFESKYKSLVENEINKYDKKWSEITKIIKVEKRCER